MAYQDITGIQIAQAAVTTGYTTIYTVAASQRLYIKCVDVCNTSGAATTFTMHLVPNGSSALVANALFCVVANATIFFDVVLTICPQGMAKTLSSKNNWAQRASDTRLFYPSFKLAKS